MSELIKNVNKCLLCGETLVTSNPPTLQIGGIALSCNCSFDFYFSAGNIYYQNSLPSYEETVSFGGEEWYAHLCNSKRHNTLFISVNQNYEKFIYQQSVDYITTQQELTNHINKVMRIINLNFLS